MTTTERKVPQDRLLSRKKPQVQRVQIAFDSEIADRHQEAQYELERCKDRVVNFPEAPLAKQELKAAEEALKSAAEELRENSMTFVIQSIGRKRWEDLVAAHPVTDDVKKIVMNKGASQEDADGLSWDPLTFPQALLLVSCVDPVLTEEEVKEIFDGETWNTAEIGSLHSTCVMVNTTRRVVDLGKG